MRSPRNLRSLFTGTVGSFFGPGITKSYAKGRLVSSEIAQAQEKHAKETAGLFVCVCGKEFAHAPAFGIHKKFCTPAIVDGDGLNFLSNPSRNAECSSTTGSVNDTCATGSGFSEVSTDGESPGTSGSSSLKLRKDGKQKQSGLQHGQKRIPHTLYLKLQVALQYERFQAMKECGEISDPLQRTSDMFHGLATSNIWKWFRQIDDLRAALTHEKSGVQKKRNRTGMLVQRHGTLARKQSLHRGRGGVFPLAEAELYAQFKVRRSKGLRVLERWLVINMRKLIRKYYGDEMADKFKGSYGWVGKYAARHDISLRRRTNHKNTSVEERLPIIKRWHARLRRRLKTGPNQNLHPKWGRWLPWNRLNIDQVPCNLREGSTSTYNEKGADRIWLAGTKADDGKRFCTLQIICRAANGPEDSPRRGQPKIGVIFRGQGLRLSQEEKDAWHPDVHVRFQPKAWADTEYCEQHAAVEMAEATAEARARGEESVAFYDNLHGQTTEGHEKNLRQKARCARHLFPGGVTGEIQLVDDGVGYATKEEMGHELDTYLEADDNLDKWVGEGPDAMKMWEKRVLITQLLAHAWEKVCQSFDFEKASTRVGMRMTVDDSGDDLIKLQGVPDYSFTDADGGDDGVDSGMDPTEAALLESEVPEGEGEDSADDGEGGGEGNDELEDFDESEDDTAEPLEDRVGGIEDPPTGFEFVEECPALATEEDMKELVGHTIMHAFATEKIFGWFEGRVTHVGCSARDLKAMPAANVVVQYKKSVTKNKYLDGRVASTLTADRYGKGEWWVLLRSFKE